MARSRFHGGAEFLLQFSLFGCEHGIDPALHPGMGNAQFYLCLGLPGGYGPYRRLIEGSFLRSVVQLFPVFADLFHERPGFFVFALFNVPDLFLLGIAQAQHLGHAGEVALMRRPAAWSLTHFGWRRRHWPDLVSCPGSKAAGSQGSHQQCFKQDLSFHVFLLSGMIAIGKAEDFFPLPRVECLTGKCARNVKEMRKLRSELLLGADLMSNGREQECSTGLFMAYIEQIRKELLLGEIQGHHANGERMVIVSLFAIPANIPVVQGKWT